MLLANSVQNLGINDEAKQYYLEALGSVPASWLIRNKLAAAYIEEGQPGGALSPLQESLAITKESHLLREAFYLQAKAYRELGELEAFAYSLEQSLKLNLSGREAFQAHMDLAEFYANKGDTERVLKHLSQNISLDPNNPNAYVARGRAYAAFAIWALSGRL